MSITSLDNNFVASTYGRFPIELDFGKGAKLYDTNGKEYIDMGTGIAVNVFGVCDDECNSQNFSTPQTFIIPSLVLSLPSFSAVKRV